MTDDNPIRFTLSNDTQVIVKKATNNKYDFELRFPNGNRKSFMWSANGTNEFGDKHGDVDGIILEAIKQFVDTERT